MTHALFTRTLVHGAKRADLIAVRRGKKAWVTLHAFPGAMPDAALLRPWLQQALTMLPRGLTKLKFRRQEVICNVTL